MHGYGVGDTVDRLDECLVAHDFDWTRQRAILDDELYELYSQAPYDVRFMIILDCCHSGGMARDGLARVRGLNPPDDVRHRSLPWNEKEQMWVRRELESPDRSLAQGQDASDYVGLSRVKHCLGRGVGVA